MPDILNKYLDSIGGIELLQTINHHTIWCHNKAKGIHQVIKEIFDYRTLYFKIEVTIGDDIVAVTEGNNLQANTTTGGVTKILEKSDISDILKGIPLVPELGLLTSTNKKERSPFKQSGNTLSMNLNHFKMKTIFDQNTGLKLSTEITHLTDYNLHLLITFDDWQWVDRLLYPFTQKYTSPHMESVREIQSVQLQFD